MSNDKSGQNGRDEMSGIGAAYSGPVFAPVWIRDEPLSDGADIEFAIAKVGADGKPTPMFNPIDFLDIVDVVQLLGQKLSESPLVNNEMRASLGSLCKDLAALMQRHIGPETATPRNCRITPPLKLVSSQH